MLEVSELRFSVEGLIPAIVQDAQTGKVLMLAYMNQESLRKSIELGETVFWSRSRKGFWHKGETSGNFQRILEIQADCDYDSLLIRVIPAGAACHRNTETCFDEELMQ